MLQKMEKKNSQNNNLLFGVVVVLLIIIAILGFFLGKSYKGETKVKDHNTPKDISIKVIDDARCRDCETEQIISQLKLLPALANAAIETKDFSDEGVSEYLKDNNITTLPAILFSDDNIDSNIDSYLTKIPSDEYSLQIGASFNPFIERSERGFTLIDIEQISTIKEWAFVKGNPDAEITWMEYSDIECPYCARLHNAGTPEDLAETYGDKLNIVFNHFPLPFHSNALPGAQILECLWEQKGSEAFYELIEKSFAEENSTRKFLIAEAVKLWANEDEIKECLSSDKYEDKVKAQENNGRTIFGITGTPGNVLINNKTGEYEVIAWAYPTSAFEDIINALLTE